MRSIRCLSVALAAAVLTAVPAAPAQAAAGFGVVNGKGGCLRGPRSVEGSSTACTIAKGIFAPAAVAVSPDGRNVYVVGGKAEGNVAESFGAIAILTRDPASGSLTATSCVSSDGTDGTDGESGDCASSPALLGADGVAVSPDGSTVFVTTSASASVVAFARNAETGALTRLGCVQFEPRPGSPCRGALIFSRSDGILASARALYVASAHEAVIAALPAQSPAPTEGAPAEGAAAAAPSVSSIFTAADGDYFVNPCIAANGQDGACTVGTAMRGVESLALSPDGAQLYAAARESGAIDVFAPGPDGGLTQPGCLMADAPKGLCTSSNLLQAPTALAASPDGLNVYAGDRSSTDGRIDVLSRGTNGLLADSSCVDELPPPEEKGDEEAEEDEEEGGEANGHSAAAGPCSQAPGITGPRALAVSADGSNVYVFGDEAAAAFSRDPATGKLDEVSCAAAEDSRCSALSGIGEVQAIAVSPDGLNAYIINRYEVLALGIGAAVTSRTASASSAGITRVNVLCPRKMTRPCSGRLLLARTTGRRIVVRHHHRVRVRRTLVGYSARFSIRPGHRARVSVRIGAQGRRMLRSRRRMRLEAIVRAEQHAGGSGFGRPVLVRERRH